MKKKIFAICVIVLCLAIATSSTVAYFTADDIAHNVITTGGIDIEIVEHTVDENGTLRPFPEEGFAGILPGDSVSKIITVSNTGTADTWIRVKIIQSLTAEDGTVLSTVFENGKSVLTLDINTEAWLAGPDGYYYHKTPVSAEASTEVLLTNVSFSHEMGNMYQSSTANIHVYAQAVQFANNGDSPLTAEGWPVDINE